MPKETENILILDDFSGGLAENKYIGLENSFFEMVGVDIFSNPGMIKAGSALKLEQEGFASEVNKIVACSDGYFYLFCADGKIYKRTDSSTYTQVCNISNPIIDAIEYNGYLYFATQGELWRWQIGSDWGGVTTKWTTLNGSTRHPMTIQQLNLYIGNSNKVAMVDDEGVWNENALDLPPDAKITSLIAYGIDLLIGTSEPGNRAGLYRWNCYDDSWNGEDWVGESGIWAMGMDNINDVIYVFAGDYGNVYYYDGTRMSPIRKIPSANEDGTWNEFDQYGGRAIETMNLYGRVVFSVLNNDGDPTPASCGVYLWGGYGKDFPSVPIKMFDFGDLKWNKLSNLRMATDGIDTLIAIRYSTDGGTTYANNVYSVEYTKKQNGAYFTTRALKDRRGTEKMWSRVRIICSKVPTDCGIKVYYKKKGDTEWTEVSEQVSAEQTERDIPLKGILTQELLLRFEFITSGSNTPEIDTIIVFLTEKKGKSYG